jgi:hypothetical protein
MIAQVGRLVKVPKTLCESMSQKKHLSYLMVLLMLVHFLKKN